MKTKSEISIKFHGKRVEIWMKQTQLRTIMAALDSAGMYAEENKSSAYADVPVLERDLVEAIVKAQDGLRKLKKAIRGIK